jgi:hypothetical protein
MFRIFFWDILPCKMIVDRRFRGTYCLHHHPRRLLWTSYSPPWELGSLTDIDTFEAGRLRKLTRRFCSSQVNRNGCRIKTDVSKLYAVKEFLLIAYATVASTPACIAVLKTYLIFEISSSHGGEYDVQNCLLGCTAGMIIPDDGGSTHLWNVGRQSFYTAVHPRRQFWISNILSGNLLWDECGLL